MHVRCLSAILLAAIAAGPLSAIRIGAADLDAPLAVENAPIKRFMQVGPRLYRGAQPDDDGFEFLRDMGIQTVVSFRSDDDERDLVESLGMSFVHIPVTFRLFGGDMPEDAVRKFLTVVDDPGAGAVFVHCRRGADRTGAFVGLYRIVRQGWGLDRAYDEARDVGMRWWYPAVKGELADFARALRSASVATGQ